MIVTSQAKLNPKIGEVVFVGREVVFVSFLSKEPRKTGICRKINHFAPFVSNLLGYVVVGIRQNPLGFWFSKGNVEYH